MGAFLGQPIIVDNKVGASGAIGFNDFVRAQPDGYTLAMGVANMITNPILLSKTTKWKTADFVGIGQIGAPPNVIVVRANHPARSLKGFAEQLRADAGKYGVGNPGFGTSRPPGPGTVSRAAGRPRAERDVQGPGPKSSRTWPAVR
jgi:tripartite-type tricarboxylate transporter receptor subunit TctC